MTRHWMHPDKNRYYKADLVRDLFGDWTLVLTWGGLDTARGRQRITAVPSYEDGMEETRAVDERRRKRGYVPTLTECSDTVL